MGHSIRTWTLFLVCASAMMSVRADSPQENAKKSAAPTDKELAEMWNNLTRADDEGTKKAFQIICRLIQHPKQSVPFLQGRLKPVPAPDAQRVEAWIAELNSDDFSKREKANAELEALGPLAMPAVKPKLADKVTSLEVRRRLQRLVEKVETNTLSGEELRGLRAVEILEAIATPEAKEVIAAIAKGAAGAKLTDDAKRAQARLVRDATLKSVP